MENEHEPARTEPVVSSQATPGSTPPPTAPTQTSKAPDQVPPRTPDGELGLAFWLKLAALLFFLGWAIAFIVGNHRTITVDFVFATGHVSLIWTILLLLLVGLIAGALFGHLYRRHGRK
jgi:uncharacterized integral membrane protein